MTYNEAISAISQFYNTSADNVWTVINDYNLTPEEAFNLIPTPDNFFNSGYGTVNYANGTTASWNNYAQLPVTSGGNPLDSNAGLVTQTQYQLPTSSDYTGGGGGGNFNGGQRLGGVPQGKVPIMTQVSTGIAAAGLGVQLGKIFNRTAYDNGFNWLSWAGVNIESLNPDTWDSITVDMSDTGFEGALKRAFNAIFASDENGSQMYIDENAAAYLAMYMDKVGLFTSAGLTVEGDKDGVSVMPAFNYPLSVMYTNYIYVQLDTRPRYRVYTTDRPVRVIAGKYEGNRNLTLVFADTEPFKYNLSDYTSSTDPLDPPYISNASTNNYNGKTFYGIYHNISVSDIGNVDCNYSNDTYNYLDYYDKFAYLALYGATETQPVEGIDNQDDATLPDFKDAITPADYLRLLQLQYPDLFQNPITQNVAQPDGTVVPHTYIPVGTPTATSTSDLQPTTDPANDGQSQATPTVNPTTAPTSLIDGLVNILTNLTTPTTPPPNNTTDTGTGDSPDVITPTGGASSLWAVYNPTQAQVNAFGAWLWDSNFAEQIKKLFADPMQAIIGLHKIFATPTTGAAQNIKVGYLDSNVPSAIVTAQYTDIDCGAVNVNEVFGNVFDYDGTEIKLYLPFIGIINLDTADVMRGAVRVIYHVDVITGACLADVTITRDGAGGVLYQYSGDAAVRYPISSGSYMGIVSGVLGVAGGIASILTGGALAPALLGAAGGLMSSHAQVKHSGGFSGAAGAMGAKIPYLIISRPQTAVANGFINYQGIGDNRVMAVGAMTGYFKMTDVHTDSVTGATLTELDALRQALERGVIQ